MRLTTFNKKIDFLENAYQIEYCDLSQFSLSSSLNSIDLLNLVVFINKNLKPF